MIRKWYFVINESGLFEYEYMIKAAVLSARKYTNLQPYCIYYGAECEILSWLVNNDVVVVRHVSSFMDEINLTEDNSNWSRSVATGAYLRLDIPLLETEDEYVIYTDCDVVFTKKFSVPTDLPKYFAVSTENEINNWNFFNTGVMVINVPAMRSQLPRIHFEVKGRLNLLWKSGFGTYDQGVLNATFKDQWSRLDPLYNWKPYWGVNDNAKIIHYHGPKPSHIYNLMHSVNLGGVPQAYSDIYIQQPCSMSYYLGYFEQFGTGDLNNLYCGFVDVFFVFENCLTISGWGVENDRPLSSAPMVVVNGVQVNVIDYLVQERIDVAENLFLNDFSLGFEIKVDVSLFDYPIDFSVSTADGRFDFDASTGQKLLLEIDQ